LDWLTILVWLSLSCIGIVSIYSALYNEDAPNILDLSLRSGRQALWLGVAAVIAIGIFLTNVRLFWSGAFVFYMLAALLVVVTLLFGKVVNGSKSWLGIAGMSIQPIEFLKVATALLVARIASQHDFSWHRFRCIVQICLAVLLPAALALLQRDTGSAMVFASFIIVFYRTGLKGWIVFMFGLMALLFIISLLLEQYAVLICLSAAAFIAYLAMGGRKGQCVKWLLITAALSAAAYYLLPLAGYKIDIYHAMLLGHTLLLPAALLHSLWRRIRFLMAITLLYIGSAAFCYSVDYVFDNILKDHQRARIEIMLGLKEDLRGAGYNVHQSKITIGSGGFTGKGFLGGTQTKYNFVPEQSTDFIFCTIGEEWGFMGALALSALFFILLYRVIAIAERQKSHFAKIYGYCAASILLFHIVVNLAMTIGLFPVIGIPLPFISYGGSAMWAFTAMVFILMKMNIFKYDQY
jgi:rod shape determining protein RodA